MAGQNDHKVLVYKKSKNYHANLLMLNIDRAKASTNPAGSSGMVGRNVMEAASAAVVECGDVGEKLGS